VLHENLGYASQRLVSLLSSQLLVEHFEAGEAHKHHRDRVTRFPMAVYLFRESDVEEEAVVQTSHAIFESELFELVECPLVAGTLQLRRAHAFCGQNAMTEVEKEAAEELVALVGRVPEQ